MITCNVLGPSNIEGQYLAGLGNQMFTIATTLALAMDNNVEAVFPDLNNRAWYGNYIDNIFKKLNILGDKSFVKHVYNQSGWKYRKIPYIENLCLNGYFQSYKFFSHREAEIRKIFCPSSETTQYIKEKFFHIFDLDSFVAVHVRRNDYLTPTLSQYHCAQPVSYYVKAMSCFPENTNFVFFSDDIEWCKQNFKGEKIYFISGEEDFIDLYFMSMAEHNIIANSTFSWWAAWLNENENKRVIAPKKWYGPKNAHLEDNDLIPNDWETM
jgi:hypothetical protein